MKRTLIAVAIATAAAVPALAQQADYCNRSGYQEGVTSDRDFNHQPCDTRAVPRVNGVPQGEAQPTARPGYNREQQAQQRYYDQQNRYYDNRAMGNRDRDWERYRGEGNYYYGARGPEWRRGGHIPREYMGRQYWVQDWRAHHLAPPPRGYQWVQVGSDYVLVAIATGIIAQLLLSQ
jgi:Ni/Co efflux regulator RcnB